jgi:hypothetical protein
MEGQVKFFSSNQPDLPAYCETRPGLQATATTYSIVKTQDLQVITTTYSIVKAQDLQAIATTYSLPSIIVLCMLLTK